jgi:hypothetical protein
MRVRLPPAGSHDDAPALIADAASWSGLRSRSMLPADLRISGLTPEGGFGVVAPVPPSAGGRRAIVRLSDPVDVAPTVE